jgi:hypothetical protein
VSVGGALVSRLSRFFGEPTARGILGTRRIATIVALVAVAAAVAVTVFAALDATIPVVWTDEMGYISNAQFLSGVGEPRVLSGRGYYYIGWSLLLVPLWWITSDPEVVYRLAVALSVVVSLATIAPLALIGKRLGIDMRWSVAIAAVIIAAPSRTALAGFALSESWLTFLLALTVVLAFRFAERRSAGSTAAVLFVAVWAFLTHARVVSVLVAVVIWVLVVRRDRWKSTALLVISAIATAGAGFLLYRVTSAALYSTLVDRETVGIDRVFGAVPSALAVAASGQLWYLQVAWLGLAAAGLAYVALHAYRGVKRRRIGAAAWAVVAILGIFVLSVIWIATRIAEDTARLDMYTYGRYLDPMATVLAFVGMAWALRGLTRRESFAIGIAQLAIVAAFAVAAIFAIARPLDPSWGPTSVPGLLAYPWPYVSSAGGPPWVLGSAVALLAAALFVLLRRRQLAFLAVILVAFTSMSVLAEVRTIGPFFSDWHSSFSLRETIDEVHPVSISFDIAGLGSDSVSQNAYQLWLAPRALPVFDSTRTAPTTEYVIARTDWPQASSLGATRVATDTGLFDNALWRLP